MKKTLLAAALVMVSGSALAVLILTVWFSLVLVKSAW